LNKIVNKNMCTLICPCDAKFKSGWSKLDEADLNKVKRTAVVPKDVEKFRDKNRNVYMIWKSTGTIFTKFVDCLALLEIAYLKDKDLDPDEVAELTAANRAFSIVKYFESKYKCSGICKPPLFYYFLDLS